MVAVQHSNRAAGAFPSLPASGNTDRLDLVMALTIARRRLCPAAPGVVCRRPVHGAVNQAFTVRAHQLHRCETSVRSSQNAVQPVEIGMRWPVVPRIIAQQTCKSSGMPSREFSGSSASAGGGCGPLAPFTAPNPQQQGTVQCPPRAIAPKTRVPLFGLRFSPSHLRQSGNDQETLRVDIEDLTGSPSAANPPSACPKRMSPTTSD